jgi:phosphatidylinositol dimannoside acyltransferase
VTAGSITMPGRVAARRPTVRGRIAARLLILLAAVLRHLPDRLLHRLAHRLGGVLFAVQTRRRALVRDNLQRVCTYLAAERLGGARVAAAAIDRHALERLVRDAFGHYVRSYLEGAIVQAYDGPHLAERVQPADTALAEQAMGANGSGQRKLIFVGLHFGAIELPALWAVRVRGLRLTSPMETVADPSLQAYFQRTRSAAGLALIPTDGAGRILADRLSSGETVAIVADRVVSGAGARVEFFGAPTRLPLGPAVLALETGAPAWAVATRRTGWGEYRAELEQIELPVDGTRRERLAGFLANQARAFERLIAAAPEQWWTLFFPIWEDAR